MGSLGSTAEGWTERRALLDICRRMQAYVVMYLSSVSTWAMSVDGSDHVGRLPRGSAWRVLGQSETHN